jgi:hypothetical protein
LTQIYTEKQMLEFAENETPFPHKEDSGGPKLNLDG